MRIILLLIILSNTNFTSAQIVNIPDENFLLTLLSKGIDTNNDNLIDFAEAEGVEFLNLSNTVIESIEGIEAFTNLKSLFCSNNQFLRQLDLTQNTRLELLRASASSYEEILINSHFLKELTIFNNALTELDLKNCSSLEILNCNVNNLEELDLSYCTKLKELTCNSNDLSEISLSNNPDISLLHCLHNNLTTIKLSNNRKLQELRITNNPISEIDLTQNINLSFFRCYRTNINLDLSNNVNLKTLDCSSSLISELDLKNNTKLEKLYNQNNLIECLDLSQNTLLKILKFRGDNNLKILRTSNTTLDEIILDNAELEFLCTTDANLALMNSTIFENAIVTKKCNYYNCNDFLELIATNNEATNLISYNPNPANDFITISSNNRISEILIYDYAGKLISDIKEIDERYYTMNIINFSSGIYLMYVEFENETIIKRIIKY